MDRVLMIAYYFPPTGSGGVQRTSKFVKYLPAFDWQPVVVTTDKLYDEVPLDPTLLEEVKDKAKIYRIFPTILNNNFFKIRSKYLQKIISLFRHIFFWDIFVIFYVRNIIKVEKIDLIYTTCPPFSINILGWYLKRVYNLPWVTDFRDQWTTTSFKKDAKLYKLSPFLHTRINLFLEKKTMQYCDFFIANTEGDLTRMRAKYPNILEKSAAIPNGYDAEDFEGVGLNGEMTDNFKLFYGGTIYYFYTPELIFQIIKTLQERNNETLMIEFRYAGKDSENFARLAEKYNLLSICRDYGYLNHKDAIRVARGANLLVLSLPDLEGNESWIPGKVYEYMAIRKPIFAILPEGDCKRIIESNQAGFTARPDEIDKAINGFSDIYDQWRNNQEVTFSPKLNIARFERKDLTRRLAAIFSSLIR